MRLLFVVSFALRNKFYFSAFRHHFTKTFVFLLLPFMFKPNMCKPWNVLANAFIKRNFIWFCKWNWKIVAVQTDTFDFYTAGAFAAYAKRIVHIAFLCIHNGRTFDVCVCLFVDVHCLNCCQLTYFVGFEAFAALVKRVTHLLYISNYKLNHIEILMII